MILLLSALVLGASLSETPMDQWACANQIEVWCAVDGCAAKAGDEVTPLSVTASVGGDVSICAYTGCWDAKTEPIESKGRLLWTADGAPFSSQPEGGFAADLTLLINRKDGVGFVRAGGLATPLICERRGPVLDVKAQE